MLNPGNSRIGSSRNTTEGPEPPSPQSLSCPQVIPPAKARGNDDTADTETCHIPPTPSSPDFVDTDSGAFSPPAQQPRQHRQGEGESRGVGSPDSSAGMMTASKPAAASQVLTTSNTKRASPAQVVPSVGASGGSSGKVPPSNAAATDTLVRTSNAPSAANPSNAVATTMHKQMSPAPPQSTAATGIAVSIAHPVSAMMNLKKAKGITSPTPTPAATAIATGKKTASGRWTREEHEQFLEGLKVYGREWKKVAQRIPSRTSAQIRSHAQKYFAKLAREEETRLATVNAIAREHRGGGDGFETGGGSVNGDGTALLLPPDQHSLLLSGASISPVQLTSSAMNRVGRILSDPEAVQVEVEDTLAALRRRYHELQRRLYGNGAGDGGDDDGVVDGSSGIGGLPRPPPTALFKEDTIGSSIGSATGRKRKIGEATEVSSITTTVIEQKPQTSKILENRELWTEELIALSVLGGSLQQGDSPKREEPAIQPSSLKEKQPKTCAHRNDAEAAADTTGPKNEKKAKKNADAGSIVKE